MARTPGGVRLRVALTTLFATLVFAGPVSAQAWVPARGEGAVSIAVQSMKVTKHLAAAQEVAAGDIDTNVVLTDVTFGLTDRIAVDLALPLVTSRYQGAFAHPNTDIDDGTYRTSLTDVRFAVRYNLVRGSAVVTPYVGSAVPSNNYAFYGHAAPGQQLRELQIGVYGAKLLERGLPGLFVSGRYGFAFVEQVLDMSRNRSLADLEVGYFFNSRFRAFTSANGGYSHGGIDFPVTGLPGLPVEYRVNHDQIQRIHFLNVGGGAAFSLTDAVDVFGSFSTQVAGRNGHAMDRGITMGVSWGFRRRVPGETASQTAPPSEAPETEAETTTAKRQGSLLRCICQKS
jgi:hypothetical protein